MERPRGSAGPRRTLSLGLLVIVATLAGSALPLVQANAQTQGTKPDVSATVAPPGDAASGVVGNGYTSPGFGFGVTWDAAIWRVEDEAALAGYEGVQLGTDVVTVFVEGYDDFSGNARECLGAATLQIVDREGVTEFQPVTSRDLPVAPEDAGEAALYIYRQSFESGRSLEVAEYVECRTLIPGQACSRLPCKCPSRSTRRICPRSRISWRRS